MANVNMQNLRRAIDTLMLHVQAVEDDLNRAEAAFADRLLLVEQKVAVIEAGSAVVTP